MVHALKSGAPKTGVIRYSLNMLNTEKEILLRQQIFEQTWHYKRNKI